VGENSTCPSGGQTRLRATLFAIATAGARKKTHDKKKKKEDKQLKGRGLQGNQAVTRVPNFLGRCAQGKRGYGQSTKEKETNRKKG